MDINTLQDNMYIERGNDSLWWYKIFVYKLYLYDIFVAQADTSMYIDKNSKVLVNNILTLSSINFQWTPKTDGDKEDLYHFMEVQEEYEQSKKLLENLIGKTTIPQLWSILFKHVMSEIRLKWDKYVELQAAWTSRWFYQKICQRLKKEDLISNFKLSPEWTLNIELNIRQFSEN